MAHTCGPWYIWNKFYRYLQWLLQILYINYTFTFFLCVQWKHICSMGLLILSPRNQITFITNPHLPCVMWYSPIMLLKKLKNQFTLSKPFSSSLLPRTSPIPARVVTLFSPMGSATKSLCFCDVDDMAAFISVRGKNMYWPTFNSSRSTWTVKLIV